MSEGPLSDSSEDSEKDSTVNEPAKKVGRQSNRKKQETKANKEKEKGTQSTLDGVVTREVRGPQTHNNPNPSKGGVPKYSHK
jgi:hypothetical protein